MQNAGFQVVLIGINPSIEEIQLTNFGAIPALILDSSELRVSDDPVLLSQAIASQLAPIVEALEPTHVYSHDFMGLSFISEVIGLLNKKRYCHWTHDIHEYVLGLEGAIEPGRLSWAKELEEQRLSIPDNIIVVNEEIRDLMLDWFSPHQRIDVLHNVPRSMELSQFDLRVACNISVDKPLAVYSGRATRLRGLDIIIPALAAMPELHVALLSQGSKPYIDELLLKAKKIGAASRLHVFPYLLDDQVSDGIKSADFGIAPFTIYGNTELALATKLFEYIHADLPIVASNCRAMAKFVTEHDCGEVFESENADDFIAKIEKVLSKPKSKYFVSKKKLEDFSWNRQIEPIIEYMKNTASFDKSRRIFHGPGPSAGQPRIISAEMQSLGVEAYCVNIVRNTTFDYGKDIFFPYKNGFKDPKNLLFWASKRFGIFHFYFRTTSNYVTDSSISSEVFQDVHILRALGAKVVMHFRGTEVRVQSMFESKNMFAWDADKDPFPGGDLLRNKILNKSMGLFDKLLVTDPELKSYVENSTVLQRAIDFKKIDNVIKQVQADTFSSDKKKIRIAHAPSRRSLKGTEMVLEAVKGMVDEGAYVELDVIENVTNLETLKRLANADLVIDQMRIGWYGVLAVEAMALGKPVVAYIRDDLVDKLEKGCPILVSNPDRLKQDLNVWIKDSKKLEMIGKKGRRFTKNYHCSKVVAKKALEIYDSL